MADDRIRAAASPLLSSEGMLGVQVSCDGKALPDTAGLISLNVRRAVGSAASARLTFTDGDMATGTWPLADGDTFAPGAAVRIEAGHDGRLQTLFEGIVVGLSVRISGDNDCRLVVECSGDVDGPLAREAATAAAPVLKLTYGEDLIEFRADLDARRQPPSAQASASEAKPQARKHRAELARISGRMSFPGSALALPGKLIAVAGVGARFNGDVCAGAVEHDIENGNWLTHVEFGLADKAVLLEDRNGNTVRLDGAGIVLTSTRDVVIRAAANIELSAGGEARIAAAADASVTALNVTCEAQVALVAHSSATAELSAAGQTTVKGAMVMIN